MLILKDQVVVVGVLITKLDKMKVAVPNPVIWRTAVTNWYQQ
jgi:hypothetical protein